MLTFLIIITAFFVLSFIANIIFGKSVEVTGLLFFAILVIVIVGWGALCLTIPQSSKNYIAESTKLAIEMKDGSFIVFYENDKGEEKMQQFYNLKDLPIKTAKQFVVKKEFNMYKGFIGESIQEPYIKDSTKVPAFLEKVEIKSDYEKP